MADYISCHLSSSIHPWNPFFFLRKFGAHPPQPELSSPFAMHTLRDALPDPITMCIEATLPPPPASHAPPSTASRDKASEAAIPAPILAVGGNQRAAADDALSDLFAAQAPPGYRFPCRPNLFRWGVFEVWLRGWLGGSQCCGLFVMSQLASVVSSFPGFNG
jgi:hypothetical protein